MVCDVYNVQSPLLSLEGLKSSPEEGCDALPGAPPSCCVQCRLDRIF